jgi:hypothetical protein
MNANQLLEVATKMQSFIDDYDEAFVDVERDDGTIEYDLNVTNKIIAFGEKHGTFAYHLQIQPPREVRNPFQGAQFTGVHARDQALVIRLSDFSMETYEKCASILETYQAIGFGLI